MPDQKIDNLLNLALDATEEERQKSGNLNTGYDPAGKTWDVIVKYTGREEELSGGGNTGSSASGKLCSCYFSGA